MGELNRDGDRFRRRGSTNRVRILFTFVGGFGHFDPLVSFARAAQSAGHTVAFGCAPEMVSMVEAAGFGVFAMGARESGKPLRMPLRPLDEGREDRDLRERFARRAARRRAPLTMALCEQCRPDVLVCDETDFGAVIAAIQKAARASRTRRSAGTGSPCPPRR